jgi:actin-related protein
MKTTLSVCFVLGRLNFFEAKKGVRKKMETRPEVPVIVIDSGSYHVRAGYPGEAGPRVSMPSLVGQPRNKGAAMAAGIHEYEVGYAAQEKRGMLQCNYPIRSGLVTNWNDVERLWSHIIFRELRVIPEDHCFVLTQPANAPQDQKEKILELAMETFNVDSLYLGCAPVFSLYSYGRTTGVVLDSGRDVTSAVPIYEGYALGRHVTSSTIAGETLTKYLCQLLKQKGYAFDTLVELELINSMKERLCYVRNPSDPSTEPGTSFSLPDGQQIPLDEHRHMCPEILFNCSILGDMYAPKCKMLTDAGEEYNPSIPKGISWLVFAAINNCEPSMRQRLFNEIVLAGGNTLFSGTRNRMQEEITLFYRETHVNEGLIPISVSEMACRQYSAWLGGCMLSRTSMFPHLTVNRREYEEQGHRVIHCKNL